MGTLMNRMAAGAFATAVAASLGFGATQALASQALSPAQDRVCEPYGFCSAGTGTGNNADPQGCGAVCSTLYPANGGAHRCVGGSHCCLCYSSP
jgi:hypothetical protein